MGRKRNLHNAARHVPRVGTFYRNVSYTIVSHVRGDEPGSRGGR